MSIEILSFERGGNFFQKMRKMIKKNLIGTQMTPVNNEPYYILSRTLFAGPMFMTRQPACKQPTTLEATQLQLISPRVSNC